MENGRRGLLGGIDGGGTTFKCGVVTSEGRLLASERFSAAQPDSTLRDCAGFFARKAAEGLPVEALGIACFGPLDVDPDSPLHGTIVSTPKPGWSGVNVLQELSNLTGLPVAIDTDVNGALLAEQSWGAARQARSAAYVTVGTGIGAGIHANGALLGLPFHPEFGHIPVERHPGDDFPGACMFHRCCLEGMVSAPAITARFGSPEAMDHAHPGWGVVAWYLAQACQTLFLTVRPERIILGGGILLADQLIERIRMAFIRRMGGYLGVTADDAAALIVLPDLGDDAGLLGGACLAKKARSTASGEGPSSPTPDTAPR